MRQELRPLFDRVVIKELEPDRVRQSGLVVPPGSHEPPPQHGIVLAVGPGSTGGSPPACRCPSARRPRRLPRRRRRVVEVDEERLLVCRVGELLGVLETAEERRSQAEQSASWRSWRQARTSWPAYGPRPVMFAAPQRAPSRTASAIGRPAASPVVSPAANESPHRRRRRPDRAAARLPAAGARLPAQRPPFEPSVVDDRARRRVELLGLERLAGVGAGVHEHVDGDAGPLAAPPPRAGWPPRPARAGRRARRRRRRR